MPSELTMKWDRRTATMETTTTELATNVKESVANQTECTTVIREISHSHTRQLSDIHIGIESYASEMKGQKNILLELQEKVKL